MGTLTHVARVAVAHVFEPIVRKPIAVIVESVADLGRRADGGTRAKLSLRACPDTWTAGGFTGDGDALIDLAVAVVVDAVADLFFRLLNDALAKHAVGAAGSLALRAERIANVSGARLALLDPTLATRAGHPGSARPARPGHRATSASRGATLSSPIRGYPA